MEQKPKIILLGLTTTPASDWRGKVEEMRRFDIKEIALFPTFLEKPEREELYESLEDINGLRVPHIHLRDDMSEEELVYLEERFHPVAYNIHDHPRHVPAFDRLRHKIFVENHFHPFPAGIVDEYAGICLDTQHYTMTRLRSPKSYRALTQLFGTDITIGCCHISPFPAFRNIMRRKYSGVNDHYMIDIREFDYVKKYVRYLPEYVSIEVENTFKEQIAIKEHLEKIINE
jgi:hypothetical protein